MMLIVVFSALLVVTTPWQCRAPRLLAESSGKAALIMNRKAATPQRPAVLLRSGNVETAVSAEPLSVPETSTAPVPFRKDFTRPMSVPEQGIAAAVEVLRSGRLVRYSSESAEMSQVALAEKEFADMTEARFAVGVNSCSSAILIALLSVGVQAGDAVLTNAFTFTAVTSTILRLGAKPILVECNDRSAIILKYDYS